MQKKMNAMMAWTVLALSVAILMGSCSRSGESRSSRHPLSEETAMQRESQTISSPGTIPPIDAAAPQIFDTATFGLG
jgi:hypothetical protein